MAPRSHLRVFHREQRNRGSSSTLSPQLVPRWILLLEVEEIRRRLYREWTLVLGLDLCEARVVDIVLSGRGPLERLTQRDRAGRVP